MTRLVPKKKFSTIKYKLLAHTFKNKSNVYSVNFSPDGLYFISASEDKINLWSIDGPLIRIFTGHTDSVTSVNFSPDGSSFISGSFDKTIKLWAPSHIVLRTKLIKSALKTKKVTRRTTNSKTFRDLPPELFYKISEYL